LNQVVTLSSSNVRVSEINVSNGEVRVLIESVIDYTYHLQHSETLDPPDWLDIGDSQVGTGGLLTFTNIAAPFPSQGFYRFRVH